VSGVYSMTGPTYSGLSKLDLLDSAMSQPLSITSTLIEEGKGGAQESFGLGTVLRRSALPEEAPVQDGFDQNGNAIVGTGDVYIPPDVGMRDALMGTWGDTPAQLERRRQAAGALTEDQYKQSPSFRKDIPYDPGMTEMRAAALAEMDDVKKVREFYAQKRPLAAFLGGMAGQALDPINYVPVGGPLVKAAAIGRFGRIGGEALAAGFDAAANTALFGVGTANARAQLGDDVSWQALISQIATAGLIGSAFGTVAGAIGRRMDARVSEAEQRLSTLKTTQEARIALNEGIDAIVRGEDVNLSPNATEPLHRVASDIEVPAPRMPAVTEPPVPEGMVRVYHSGSVGEGETGRWVSTNRQYAADYRPDLPLHYMDLPADDPRLNNADIPEQGIQQGFTFNFEATPKEAAQLKEISRGRPPTDLTTEPLSALNEGIDAIVRGEDVNLSPNSTEPLQRVANEISPTMLSGDTTIKVRSETFHFDNGRSVGLTPNGDERILGAAVKIGSDIYVSQVHADAIDLASRKTGLPVDALFERTGAGNVIANVDGFLTNRGRFVDRAEAADIAAAADQVAPIGERSRRQSGDLVKNTRELFAEQLDQPLRQQIDALRAEIRALDHVAPAEMTQRLDALEKQLHEQQRTASIATEAPAIGQPIAVARPAIDTSRPAPETPPQDLKRAQTAITKPEDAKALAAQYGVDANTGAFKEESEIAQLADEGRLTEEDAQNLAQAQADFETADAYAEALKSVAGCLI